MKSSFRPIAILVWTGIALAAAPWAAESAQPSASKAQPAARAPAPGASKATSKAAAKAAEKSPPSAGVSSPARNAAAAPSPAPSASSAAIDPLDWYRWRGPEQNGISRETGLPSSFNAETKENLLWLNTEAAGISSPIVMRGKLYTLVRDQPETKREREKVLCLDAATGEKIWENAHNVYLSDVPAERVGWSNCVGDPTTGRVFAQGVNGFFQCLDGETGKEIWSRSLHEEFGLVSTYGGRTNTPVVFEDLVIASAVVTGWGEMAVPAHRFIAMDKNTGEVRWFNGTGLRPEDTTYSTPVLTVLDGQAAMVFGSSDGCVWAFQPRTGKPIWNFKLSRRGINVSPVVDGDTVYVSQGEENLDNTTMGSLVAFKGVGTGDITKTNEIWRVKNVIAGKSSLVLWDGRVYCADDGANLYIVDAKTGKPVTSRPTKLTGRLLSSSPVVADGKIYLMAANSFQVMEPTKAGVKFLDKQRLESRDIIIGSPAVSHGRVYLPTPDGLYCLGLPNATPQAAPIPPAPVERPATAGDPPAWVQIVPAEILIKPGEIQKFTVRAFNARGQELPAAPATFTLSGPGTIDENGAFHSPADAAHVASIVTAKIGQVAGQARIRIVPPLPWKFDFNDVKLAADAKTKAVEGEPTITWVGARYRHKVREIDGEKVMVKVTTIPKGTRSQCWMGPTDLHDYTIQADLRGATSNTRMPDMGLIAQRYTLDMMGQKQQLQIRSWTSQVKTRFSKDVPFAWQPNVWYTLKFQASTEGGKAVLRGKAWPRDSKEPEAWTIEAVDEVPNLQGSPGLFGMSNFAEIYIDNILVSSNSPAPANTVSAAARSTP